MAIRQSVSGAQVGQSLVIKLVLDGLDLVDGQKWRLDLPGLSLSNPEQTIPAGATAPHTLTWTSTTPIPAGTTVLNAELWLATVPPVSKGTFAIPVTPAPVAPIGPAPSAPAPAPATPAPATPAAPAPAIPQPLQVQVVGQSSAVSRILNGGTFIGLGTALVILAIIAVIVGGVMFATYTGINGLSSHPTTTAPTKDSVTTTVTQTVITDDPDVLKEAAKGNASITH